MTVQQLRDALDGLKGGAPVYIRTLETEQEMNDIQEVGSVVLHDARWPERVFIDGRPSQ